MRRAAPCLSALLLCSAISAHAGGLDLSWDHCRADGAVTNKAFACLSDLGQETLVGSFVLAVPMSGIVRLEATIEFQAPTFPLFPGWLYPGACLGLQPGSDAPAPPASCPHWPSLGDPGVISSLYLYPATNEYDARLMITNTIVTPDPGGALAGVEYQAFRLLIPHAALVGTASCGGCANPLTIALNQVRVTDGHLGSQTLDLPRSGGSNQVSWQSGGPTTTRYTTWAAVKSLYR